MLQHAGGQLCPQQSAACGVLTESGKIFSPPLPAQEHANTDCEKFQALVHGAHQTLY